MALLNPVDWPWFTLISYRRLTSLITSSPVVSLISDELLAIRQRTHVSRRSLACSMHFHRKSY
jgi:hypothetical protein